MPKEFRFSAGQLDCPRKVCFRRECFWDSDMMFTTAFKNENYCSKRFRS